MSIYLYMSGTYTIYYVYVCIQCSIAPIRL
jgi:hypothetical protein